MGMIAGLRNFLIKIKRCQQKTLSRDICPHISSQSHDHEATQLRANMRKAIESLARASQQLYWRLLQIKVCLKSMYFSKIKRKKERYLINRRIRTYEVIAIDTRLRHVLGDFNAKALEILTHSILFCVWSELISSLLNNIVWCNIQQNGFRFNNQPYRRVSRRFMSHFALFIRHQTKNAEIW